MKSLAAVLPTVALLAACARYHPYIPEERATATLGGRTAATYPIPSDDAPMGDLRVASYGVAELLQERTDRKVKALHVRLAVANNSATRIAINVEHQRIQLPDGRHVAPVLARSEAGRGPVVEVPPASSRALDMFFPFERIDSRQPPRFDVVWRVEVGNTPMLRVTPFDQVRFDPAVARQEALHDGFYGSYWYDTRWGPGRWWW